MTDYKQFISALEKKGYNKQSNISDFWFKNKAQLASSTFGNTADDDLFSLLVR
jgi:hypothetical protein